MKLLAYTLNVLYKIFLYVAQTNIRRLIETEQLYQQQLPISVFMGCVSSTSTEKRRTFVSEPVFQKPKVLTLEIKHLYFTPTQQSNCHYQDYCLKLWVSNQIYQIPLEQVLQTPNIDFKMKFILNSIRSKHGRTMNMQIQNIKKPGMDSTAFGLIDLEGFMKKSEEHTQQIIHMNFLDHPAGFAQVNLNFKDARYEQVSFRLYEPTFRNTDILQKKLKLKISFGEQVFEVKLNKSSNTFFGQPLDATIFIPKCLKHGTVSLIAETQHSQNSLGMAIIDLSKIFRSRQLQIQIQQILSFCETIIGSLKLTVRKLSLTTERTSIKITDMSDMFSESQKTQYYKDPKTLKQMLDINNMDEIPTKKMVSYTQSETTDTLKYIKRAKPISSSKAMLFFDA